MGVITPDRFNPIKAFCSVRLQQGVPLVDADVNELDDIRKFEVRAFLKWFVGNGVPEGNDGFRIAALPSPAPDNFRILVGGQLLGAPPATLGPEANNYAVRSFGRCIVDGLDVMITSNTKYREQPNFTAAEVQPIPDVAGPVMVYIDVWERLVRPSEDATIIVPPLGTETCARMKREWVVRTRPGTRVPILHDPDYKVDHSYYGLALINRRIVNGAPAPILPNDITDLRETGLSIAPSTLVADTVGGTASDYRHGKNRPAISLRDALNAVLRNEVPATPEIGAPHSGSPTESNNVSYAVTFDAAGGVNLLWTSVTNSSSQVQVLAARLDPARPEAGFVVPPQPQVAAGPATHYLPHAAALPTGDIVVAYTAQTGGGAPTDVFFKRASDVGSLNAAAEQRIRNGTGGAANWHPFVVVVPATGGGGYVIFFWHSATGSPGTGNWMFRRRRYAADWAEATATWAGDAAVLGGTARLPQNNFWGPAGGFHAAVAADGNVWVAYEATGGIQAVRLAAATGALFTPAVLNVSGNLFPFVMIDRSGFAWIFFYAQAAPGGVFVQQYRSMDGNPIGGPTAIPGTADIWVSAPTAALDAQNGIWLFWRSGNPTRLSSIRRSPLSNTWGPARTLSASMGDFSSDGTLVAVNSPNGTVWLVRQGVPQTGYQNVFAQQVLVQI